MSADLRSRLRWDDVKIFAALMREGSLTRAARRLKIDDSTVSRRLAAFERAIGVTLFDRHRDGLRPLAAAEQLFREAENVEMALASLTREAGALERIPTGVVRLTAPPLLSELLLVPALQKVARLYPDIQIEIDASTRLVQLTRREADIALRLSRPESGDLIARRLMTLPLLPYASASYAQTLPKPVCAWSDVRWIGWEESMSHLPVARWLDASLAGASPWFRSSSQPVQVAAVAEGLGVAMLAEPVGRMKNFERVQFAPELLSKSEQLPEDEVWMVGHRALRDTPRIRAVWDALAAEIDRLLEADRLPRDRRSQVDASRCPERDDKPSTAAELG